MRVNHVTCTDRFTVDVQFVLDLEHNLEQKDTANIYLFFLELQCSKITFSSHT